MSTKRSSLITFALVGTLIAVPVFIYATFVFLTGSVPTWTATTEACTQPDSIAYRENISYSVYVNEPTFSLSFFGEYPKAVVSVTGSSSYGVWLRLNHSTKARDVTCIWEPDRVEIVEPNGIRHIVPANVFVGGR